MHVASVQETTHGRQQVSSSISHSTALWQRHMQFETLVDSCEREELKLCLRLLGMYLGIYKLYYGEIPAEDCTRITESAELDGELGEIVESGLSEASTMLEMVRCNSSREQVN